MSIDKDEHHSKLEVQISKIRKISWIIPLVLFAASLFVVQHLLEEYTLDELLTDLSAIPSKQIALAILLSIANYCVLTFYDILGTRYVGATVPIKKVAAASFVAYAFSQNLGLSLLSGGAVRYRFYQREGISGGKIAKIISFTVFHFWMGLFILAGVIGISNPGVFADLLHLPQGPSLLIGFVLILPGIGYVLLVCRPKLLPKRLQSHLPSPRIAVGGLLVCIVDWLLAASVFFTLLHGEHTITVVKTISAFLVAQVIAVSSHVPGGLGVFEATVGYLLSPEHDNSALLSSLVAFRIIYYFIPFLLSIALLVGYEVLSFVRKNEQVSQLLRPFEVFHDIFLALASTIASISVFFCGLSLLTSSSYPDALQGADQGLRYSLTLFELSHFTSSILGIVLIFIGVGLRRKVRETWLWSCYLIAFAIALSILKQRPVEPFCLGLALLFLYAARSTFYRTGSLNLTLGKSHLILICGAALASISLGIFSYREVSYSNELWWTFVFNQNAPRFLRAIVGMCIGVLLCASYLTFVKTRKHLSVFPDEEELAKALSALSYGSSTTGLLSMTRDKELLFSEDEKSFLMWRQMGSSFICFSDPQGSDANAAELMWKFRELADSAGKICAFYEISPATIPHALDLGLQIFKIGEEGFIDLRTFSLRGAKARSFRTANNKMGREGVTFRVLEKEEAIARIDELEAISNQWLLNKNASEKGFSLGYFDKEYIARFRCSVVEAKGKIIAFANLFETANKSELSIDLMRQSSDSPNGVMDFLFMQLFLWGQENGYASFSLGMAPLSGFADNPLAPKYLKLGGIVFRHGGHFYNFEGLRRYKDKFSPEWSPRYIACPNSLCLPIVLSNISRLISRGPTAAVANKIGGSNEASEQV